MTIQKTVAVNIQGATVHIPEETVIENWLQSTGISKNPGQQISVGPPPIGHYWPEQGGIYAGIIGDPQGQDYHLIVADSNEGETKAEWGETGTDEDDATCARDGKKNTAALVTSQNAHPAAEWADRLNINGHHDWYLPARCELALCYINVPELFAKERHWSSTQFSANRAWYQDFSDGDQSYNHKDRRARARAVRRFKLPI